MNDPIETPSRTDLPGKPGAVATSNREIDALDFSLDNSMDFSPPKSSAGTQSSAVTDHGANQPDPARRQKKHKRTRDTLSQPKAYTGQMLNRWPRAIARSADLLLFMSIVLVAYSLITGTGLRALYQTNLFGFVALILATLPIAIVLDGLVAALLGNTPAKAIIGVRATSSRGERLNFITHLRRSYGVWTDGLAMGLFPLSLATLVRQFKRVSGRREATYDERLHVRMRSGAATGLRALLLALGLTAVAGYGIVRGAGTPSPDSTPSGDASLGIDAAQNTAVVTTDTVAAAPAVTATGSEDDTSSVPDAGAVQTPGPANANARIAAQNDVAQTTTPDVSDAAVTATIDVESPVVVATETQVAAGQPPVTTTTIWSNPKSGLNMELDPAFTPQASSEAPELATFDHSTLPLRVKTYFWRDGRPVSEFLQRVHPGVAFGNDTQLQIDSVNIDLQVGENQRNRIFVQAADIDSTKWLITAQAPKDLTDAEAFEKLDNLRLSLWSTIVP